MATTDPILSVEDLLKHVGIAADSVQQVAAALAHDDVGFKTLDDLKLATDQDLQNAGVGVVIQRRKILAYLTDKTDHTTRTTTSSEIKAPGYKPLTLELYKTMTVRDTRLGPTAHGLLVERAKLIGWSVYDVSKDSCSCMFYFLVDQMRRLGIWLGNKGAPKLRAEIVTWMTANPDVTLNDIPLKECRHNLDRTWEQYLKDMKKN